MTTEAQLDQWLATDAALPLLLTAPQPAPLAEALLHIRNSVTEYHELIPTKTTITVKEVRETLATVQTTSWNGTRIVAIPQAELLGPEAANALLKTLEEGQRFSRFVLATRWPQRLLTTIRSRCQRMWVGAHSAPSATTTPLAPRLELLVSASKEQDLDDELLGDLEQTLLQAARHTPTPQVKNALMRLRDYYRIRALKGNVKLAKDVLIASLPDSDV